MAKDKEKKEKTDDLSMYKVTWTDENGSEQVTWCNEKEKADEFVKEKKLKGLSAVVKKGIPETMPKKDGQKDNPDRIVNDKQKSIEKFVEDFVQIQNPKSKMWKKIDKEKGIIVGSRKIPYKGIPVISSFPKGVKDKKVEEQLYEFQIELIPTTPNKTIINYNGKETTMGELPKNVYDSVKFVIGKLRPEEKKGFYKDDTGTWDIVSKADGTLVVTDDEGKDYTKELKKRIKAAKL